MKCEPYSTYMINMCPQEVKGTMGTIILGRTRAMRRLDPCITIVRIEHCKNKFDILDTVTVSSAVRTITSPGCYVVHDS